MNKTPKIRFIIVHYVEEHIVKAFRVWDNYFDVSASPWFAKLEKAESAIPRAAGIRHQISRQIISMKTDIITRMEAMQSCFNPFPSLLQSAENDRRLQLNDRADWVQDGDPPALPGESEFDYNERTGRYDQ